MMTRTVLQSWHSILRFIMSGLVTGCLVVSAQAQQNESPEKTTVSRELEKLFKASGQQVPSFKTKDLPYANSPQMHRIRRSDGPQQSQKSRQASAKTPARPPQKKERLFGRLFNRFRRNDNDVVDQVPEPPSIITRDREFSGQQPKPSHQKSSGSVHRTASADQQQKLDRRVVRPAAFGRNAASAEQRPAPTANTEGDLFTEEKDELLGQDAVGKIPQMTSGPDASPIETSKDALSNDLETEENPFTGRTISDADEFESPFFDNEPTLSDGFNPFAEPLGEGNPFAENDPPQVAESDSAESSVTAIPVAESAPLEMSEEQQRLAPEGFPLCSTANAEDDTLDQSLSTDVDADETAPSARRTSVTREQKIDARRHLSGFLGFCPVVLRDKQDLADADEQFQVTFGLKSYWFSSKEAQQAFEKNPTRYAPVAGGSDVVSLINSGEQQVGSIRYGMWYHERLYLFHSQETRDIFCDSPGKFADEY